MTQENTAEGVSISSEPVVAKAAGEEKNAKNGGKKPLNKVWGKLKRNPLFLFTVVLPTVCATVYFGAVASSQYTSEASFVVRSSKNQSSLGSLGAILQTAGIARAQDDTYTVQNYIRSRTALNKLVEQMPVRKYYEEQGDILSRFNSLGLSGEHEAFYQFFTKKVGVDFDTASGISTLSVTAFQAKEAQQINASLLQQAEGLINQLNERARADTVRYAMQAIQVAEERVAAAAANLTDYRTKNGVFDLNAQTQVQMGLVSKLQDELIAIQTQLDQVRAVTPENPQIPGLSAREQSLRKEIAQQSGRIAGGNSRSLSQQAAGYQRVVLENDLAQKQLAAAIASFESAKAEADRQQLYLEVIAQPSQPDLEQKPKRLYNIVATFLIGLMLYGILSLLLASIREHKN